MAQKITKILAHIKAKIARDRGGTVANPNMIDRSFYNRDSNVRHLPGNCQIHSLSNKLLTDF